MADILVVDDNLPFQTMLVQALRARGHTVDACDDGEQALSHCDGHPYELVICDILMPNKDGIDTIVELKRNRRHPAKVLAVSGGSPKLNGMVLLNSADIIGADATLAKPFTLQQLYQEIDRLLADGSAAEG